MDRKLEIIPHEEDVQKEWDRLGNVMKESLQENVGPRRSNENNAWFREKMQKGSRRTVPSKINATK
jgi:hypothetical protein